MDKGLFQRAKFLSYLLGFWSIVFISPFISFAAEMQLPLDQLLTCHTSEVVFVKYSPSGTELASVDRNGCIVLWDVILQKEIGRFQMPRGDCNASKLQWDSSGETLLCWADLAGAIIIDRASLRHRILFSKSIDLKPNANYYSTTQALTISPDGKYVLRGANGAYQPLGLSDMNLVNKNEPEINDAKSFLELINLKTREIQKLDAPYPLLKVIFTKKGRFLAVDFEAAIIAGDINKGVKTTRIARKDGKKIESVCTFGAIDVTPDGKIIILGGDICQIELFQNLPLKKFRTLRMIKTEIQDIQLQSLLNTIRTVAISADGARVAAGTIGGSVQIWDNKSGKTIRHLKLYNTHVSSRESAYEIRFVPQNNQTLIVRSAKRNLFVFNLNKRTRIKLKEVGTFDLSPDGKLLAVSDGKGGAVLIYKMPN